MKDLKGLKIVRFEAENIKRLVAVEIEPDGNVVEITGANGQGKTSILDAIYWLFAGKASHQAEPIRRGENEARIEAVLGDIVVKRTFRRRKAKREGEPETITTQLTLESEDGARYGTPQEVLNAAIDPLAFDPHSFLQASPAEQYAMLAKLVGLDFSESEKFDKADRSERTIQNRIAKDARARAAAITVPAETPEEAVDIGALTARIEEAGEANRQREAKQAERAATAREIEAAVSQAERLAGEVRELRLLADRKEAGAQGLVTDATRRKEALDALPPLAETVDTQPIRAEIDQAQLANAHVAKRAEKVAHAKEAAAAEKESERLTERLDKRKAERAKAVAEADMPVEGLSLEDGVVTLGGFPLDQGSDADQLRLSMGIAMRQRSGLRICRVRNASLFDENALALIREMADEYDCQVWLERVDTSGKIGVVIEDGRVKGETT